MSRIGFALSMAAVVAAASWTYHINYRTKLALERIDDLRAGIAAEREATNILRVEWAYLNRPERLRRLVEASNDQLQLEPMGPQHFDDVAAVPFPPRPSEWMQAPALATEAASDEEILAAAIADAIATVGAAPAPETETQTLAQAEAPMPPPRPVRRNTQ
ncbi:MAG TPA: hypothetical protein VLA52_07275 [Thermohalobaculum sp.]|nr:hypothetical protein [Thermohalobaculum sp.]